MTKAVSPITVAMKKVWTAPEGVAEPVPLLALCVENFQRAEPDRDQNEADVIDLEAAPPVLPDLLIHARRILDDEAREHQRGDADGDVDIEDPAPGVVVADVSPQHGTEDRRDDDRDAVDGHRHAQLFLGERVDQDALLGRLEPATAEPLEDPEEDQQLDAGRGTTEGRADGEEQHARHVEPLAAEQSHQPAGERQHDRIGHEVAGEHPGRLAPPDGEAAGDIRQRDVGDRRVEHLHERRQGDGQGDEPVIDGRLDLGPLPASARVAR